MRPREKGDLYATLDTDAAISRLFDFGASQVTTLPLQMERTRTLGIVLTTNIFTGAGGSDESGPVQGAA